jgi:hypothetical protein
MAKKERNKKPFLEKMRFRYRISIMDENSLEEKFFFRLSRLSLFLYGCSFTVVTFFILSVLLYSTPLRYYLPGYGDAGNREIVIAEALRADSLQKQMNLKIAYLNVIKDVMLGNMNMEEIQSLDSFLVWDRIDGGKLEPSEHERRFIEQFENEELFNLSTINPRAREDAYVFFRPVRGIIEQSYNPFEGFLGVSIITPPNENVLSVLDGTVIYTDFSFNNGWVIQIKHEGNYISMYKNNTRLLKKVGDIVHAGESIAITGSATDGRNFYFELWHNGRTVNPEDIISF